MNASGWSPRLQRDKGIDMSLIPVDTALQAGITDIFAVAGEINPHLFTHPLEDLGHSPELGGIHVVDTQHRVLMALLRAKRRGATVRAGTDHLEREDAMLSVHDMDAAKLRRVAQIFKRVREQMGINLPSDGKNVRYTGLQSRVNGNETHINPLVALKPGAPPAGVHMPSEGQMPH